jgi:hypothetical protein
MAFTCKYCNKDFIRENSLEKHMCESKRRVLSKDEPGVRFGFQSYLKFYTLTQSSSTDRTFEDFTKSSYYKAFVKFGRYCYDTKVINPLYYLEWLLKKQKKIDNWASDRLYTEYLQGYLKHEHVNDALTRAIEFGIAWQESQGYPSNDCLRYGNPNTIMYAITSGKISPWVIYNCESGQKFLASLNSEQINFIWSYIDSDIWNNKFSSNKPDVEFAKKMLNKAGW